ncbi:hypothetical protein F5I97DRAFT_2004418 [Phlebopus sp. FC_14]|nr:hypothetical protein F5I97DRAFT_2004418 [Phlebopus sp. FC_14]
MFAIHSQPDADKRRTFKAAYRLAKDMSPDVHTSSLKSGLAHGSGGKLASDDRYKSLLKKIDDLERARTDEKKKHQADLARHKVELAHLNKTNTEQLERLEKLKKQNDSNELRIQELRKSNLTDQAEIKELRVKLRMSEHERAQLAGKQGEADDAKKTLQSLAFKRREGVKERDKKITELEEAVAAEKKEREMLESCLHDVKTKADEEALKLRANAKSVQRQLDAAQKENRQVHQTVSAARDEAADREEEIVTQLQQCKAAISRVAEEYGQIASATVSSKVHAALKTDYVALQVRSLRLERKLANSEDQVAELAYLIRQTQGQNEFLSQQLQDAEQEAAFYSQMLHERTHRHTPQPADDDLHRLEDDLAAIHQDITATLHCTLRTVLQDYKTAHDLHCQRRDDLFLQVSMLNEAINKQRNSNQILLRETAQQTAHREAAESELQKRQDELLEANQVLTREQLALAEARQSLNSLRQKSTHLEKQLSDEKLRLENAQQKERDTFQKLSTQLQMSKSAETALTADIERLQLELADASRFQDAYYKLVDEMKNLLARNNLAEEEAERLSKFNAEILGHHNPAQRIMYVDRIRRELADTKQKLVVCARDRDTLATTNEQLYHELELYKSSAIPTDNKPRSLFVRVTRPPLVNQSMNVENSGMNPSLSVEANRFSLSEQLPGPGDMTLDELI